MPNRTPSIPIALLTALLLGSGGLGGCLKQQEGLDSASPSKRLDAIVDASGEKDIESLQGLVSKLDSSEPAERMLAIRALERRTGTTVGYDHAAPDWQRREAVNRWVEYAESDSTSEAPGARGG
ncbi:MAG: hypothetical protein AAF995_09840 [Planctomycetota bacterium]